MCQNPLAGISFAEAIPAAQAVALKGWIDQDDQNPVDPFLGSGFKQQGRFVNDQVVRGLPESRQATFGEVGNRRMGDLFKKSTGRRLGEDQPRESLPVEPPLLCQDTLAKSRRQLFQNRAAGVDNLSSQLVGAYHERTMLREACRDSTFT